MIDSNQKNGQASLLRQRVSEVRARLKERSLDALLVSSVINRFYLTAWQGDTESGFVLVTHEKNFIITDSRYTEHVSRQTGGFEVVETSEGIGPTLADLLGKNRLKRVGYESHDLSVFSYQRIKKFTKGAKLVPVAHLIEDIRAVKGDDEISKLKKSSDIAAKTFNHIFNFIKPGVTEVEIAWQMEKYMRQAGAEKMALETFIVAGGAKLASLHQRSRG